MDPFPGSTRSCSLVLRLIAAFAVLFGLGLVAPIARAQDASSPAIALTEIASGYTKPTFIANAGDGSGRLFIVEKRGLIKIVADGEQIDRAFLNITRLVRSKGNEQGLLSVAFHPRYEKNRQFFVEYNNLDGDLVIARYLVDPKDANVADHDSAEILLTVPKPNEDHNSGQLAFGPDGYLYIGVGDGGANSEPERNAQRTDVLLGKVLRIDIDHEDADLPYAIPPDNPFVGNDDARPEIWAYGLRNPWRFSFDSATGDLFIGDVGLWMSEEVNIQPAGAAGGANYGWNIREGDLCHDQERAAECESAELTSPAFYYHHELGCAIVGGYVYHGADFPELEGLYFVGDFCSGNLWTLAREGDAWIASEPTATGLNISTFGVDEAGELYLADFGGTIYRVEPA
jgi:glucose/arabinose dehydrogenase